MNTIKIKFEKLDPKYGEGKLGKIKLEAYQALPTMSLIVEVEGKKYKVNNQDIIEAVIEMHKKK